MSERPRRAHALWRGHPGLVGLAVTAVVTGALLAGGSGAGATTAGRGAVAVAGAGRHASAPATAPYLGPGTGALAGVSCVSASWCEAVGWWTTPAGVPEPLAEHFDGTVWSIQGVPGPTRSQLTAVSCPTDTFCEAVGYTGEYTFAEAWNGSGWAIQTTPDPADSRDNELAGVSCVSVAACTAVGSYDDVLPSGVQIAYDTLAETWDGRTWTVGYPANPSSDSEFGYSALTGISCTAPGTCTAVGTAEIGMAPTGIAEGLSGSTWTVQGMPDESTSDLAGVSCPSASACVAVGSFVARWSSPAWAVQYTPVADTQLNGVSCTSPDGCTAVGEQFPSHSNHGLFVSVAEVWNGTTWTEEPTVSPSQQSSFAGVSCPSASTCVAVGHFTTLADGDQPLAETWDGSSWSETSSPGLACPGYYEVMADGSLTAVDTASLGSMGGKRLAAPMVGVGAHPGGGYWEVAADGGIFAFGAPFLGSMGGRRLAAPVVGMAADPAGGYWEVAGDGGIFAFGAPFLGSMGGRRLAAPVVGMAADPAGGYWEVASDGGVFSFGAPFFGSMGGRHLASPVVGMASTPDGGGYWEVAADGAVYAFGDARFFGAAATSHPAQRVVSLMGDPLSLGYWELTSAGALYSFDAPACSAPASRTPIVGAAGVTP